MAHQNISFAEIWQCKYRTLIKGENMDEKVSSKITFIDFWMAVLMVVYHLGGIFNHIYDEGKVVQCFNRHYSQIGVWALSFFFMKSGYLLYRNADCKKKVALKIRRKLKSLIGPFVFWNVVALLLEMIFLHQREIRSIKDIVIGFTINPFDGIYWYVFALVILLLLFPVTAMRNRRLWFMVAISVLCICFFPWKMIKNKYQYGYWIERLMNYCPSYFLGAALGGVKAAEKNYNRMLVHVCRILLMLIIVESFLHTEALDLFILKAIGIPILIWISIDKEIFKTLLKFPLKISFYLFSLHGLLIGMIMKAGGTYFAQIDNGFSVICLRYLLCVLIYGVSLLIAYVVEIKSSDKMRILISGGRVRK